MKKRYSDFRVDVRPTEPMFPYVVEGRNVNDLGQFVAWDVMGSYAAIDQAVTAHDNHRNCHGLSPVHIEPTERNRLVRKAEGRQ